MDNQTTQAGVAIESTPLLACPFCGAQPHVRHIGNEHLKDQVCEIACSTWGCFARQRVGILNKRGHTYDWAEQKCREKWNTRHANMAICVKTHNPDRKEP